MRIRDSPRCCKSDELSFKPLVFREGGSSVELESEDLPAYLSTVSFGGKVALLAGFCPADLYFSRRKAAFLRFIFLKLFLEVECPLFHKLKSE